MAVGSRVLDRPLTLYNEIRRQTAFDTERHPEVRDFKRRNGPNIERGLVPIALAEEHGLPIILGALRTMRFSPKRLDYVLPLRRLIRDIERPNHDAIVARRRWRSRAALGDPSCRAPQAFGTTIWDRITGRLRPDMGPMPTLPDVWTDEAYRAIAELADIVDFGISSLRVVTTAGVNFLVDTIQGTFEPEIMRYHGIGTGAAAEAAADTALGAELSTAYNPDSTRAQGTLQEGASANIYRSVGTNNVDGSATITEHGLFTQAATSGGTLWDRSVYAGQGLVAGNSYQTTYDATFAASG